MIPDVFEYLGTAYWQSALVKFYTSGINIFFSAFLKIPREISQEVSFMKSENKYKEISQQPKKSWDKIPWWATMADTLFRRNGII